MICAVLDVWFNTLTLCFKLKSFFTLISYRTAICWTRSNRQLCGSTQVSSSFWTRNHLHDGDCSVLTTLDMTEFLDIKSFSRPSILARHSQIRHCLLIWLIWRQCHCQVRRYQVLHFQPPRATSNMWWCVLGETLPTKPNKVKDGLLLTLTRVAWV